MNDDQGSFSTRIIQWQETHGRHDLPWQNTRDPYRVWLSEVMLQQTQVNTVLRYFSRFLERFPHVFSLAEAPLDEILVQWSGLGYYSRARNLHRCAQAVVARWEGKFPTNAHELQSLPGIGPSTAAAIAAFCFGEPVSILDGNVKRVLSRYLEFDRDVSEPASVAALWRHATALLPVANLDLRMPRYTQGLMDLGSKICSQRKPSCEYCPVRQGCRAFASGRQNELPKKTRKSKRVTESVWLLQLTSPDGKVLLNRRASQGVWAGLYCLPAFSSREILEGAIPLQSRHLLVDRPVLPHSLTHKQLLLHCVELNSVLIDDMDGGVWVSRGQLGEYGLPAPIKKLLLDTQ